MTDFFKAVRSFITDYLPKQKCCSANTIRSYRFAINLLVRFLRENKQLTVQKITFNVFSRELFIEFLEWLETERHCTAASRNQRLAALRSFFAFAGLMDCVNMDIHVMLSKIPRKNKPGKVVEFLSESSLEILLQQPNLSERLGLRNGFFMILMYDSAARCDEIINLKLSDIKVDTAHPVAYLTGKGNKTRIVPLMNKTVEHYKRYLTEFHCNSVLDDGYVFYTVIHGRQAAMSPDTPAAFMKRYGENARMQCAEIPQRVHPHMLRHTRAIHLYRNGMPLELLSQFLGHASIDTTRIYAYADSEMKREAIIKADNLLNRSDSIPIPVWAGDDDMILKLSGLK